VTVKRGAGDSLIVGSGGARHYGQAIRNTPLMEVQRNRLCEALVHASRRNSAPQGSKAQSKWQTTKNLFASE
jgi:hypothetical protein